jgi:endoglucanase
MTEVTLSPRTIAEAGACVVLTLAIGATAAAAVESPEPADPHSATRETLPNAAMPRTSASDNPLANRTWGIYAGPGDQAWLAWSQAEGETKTLLEKIVFQPKSKWYGQWIATDTIRSTVEENIANAQAGDPNALVQFTVFRLKPWEEEACTRLPTKAEQSDYKAWIDEFAAGIGSTPSALVLQPDGPFALCAPHGSKVPSKLIRYAAQVFSALPATQVYIDTGASDWLRNDPAKALKILLPAGIDVARGFSLNNTHYAATSDEVAFGAAVVKALAKRGIKGKHFVVNTAANGRPFNGYEYKGHNFDNAKTCTTKRQRVCVTLGIPPSADVANSAWGLSKHVARLARKYADGYLWVGRPWLFMQADPFVMQRALDVARTTPY